MSELLGVRLGDAMLPRRASPSPPQRSVPTARALVEEIAWREPLDALAALGTAPGLVLLDSAMPHPRLGRWSWLGVDPFGRFTCSDGRAHWDGTELDGPPLDCLRHELQRVRCERGDEAVPFAAGASGFFAYEAGRLFERLPAPKWRNKKCPEIDLAFHDVGLAFDMLERRAFIVSTGLPVDDPLGRRRRAHDRTAWLRERLESRSPRLPNSRIDIPRRAWRSNFGAEKFMAVVERTRRYIADGDIFQANLAQTLRAELPPGFDPLTLYAQLRASNPAPFGALIVTPDRVVASTSPESFLSLENGHAETRPIKGTVRRSADPETDRHLADALLASEKDRAENIMIVDLMRNDLFRVSRPGTVQVPVLCGLESYEAVHHLVSVVESELLPGLDALNLLAACFPGGSITGAPKIRAMEIIHELEPEARGVYCGSIVHLGFDGSLRSNIAIRTLVVEDGTATVRIGGGITLLSDPKAEYAETLLKAERILAAFEPAALP